MDISGNRESENVEDRRGMGGAGLALGGIGSVAVVVLGLIFGFDPRPLLQNQQKGGPAASGPKDPAEEKAAKFTSVVLASTEDVWGDQFPKLYNRPYKRPKLVMFSGSVQSACGRADASVGPFYCPGDSFVYIDLSFFKEMEQRFKIPGDFPRAYVVAHEVGHHIQNQLGYSKLTDSKRGGREENQYSVRLELQADYLAGVWAYHAKNKFKLDGNDIKQALNAAHQIGDDALTKGRVRPDAFTHGTSQQRERYLREGFESGDGSKQRLDQFFSVLYERL